MDEAKYDPQEASVAQIHEQDVPQRFILRASSPRGLMIICITATAKLVDDMLWVRPAEVRCLVPHAMGSIVQL
jgi:hypothetical protein